MYDLQRLLQALPVEGGSEDAMALHQILPGVPECLQIQISLQTIQLLVQIDRVLGYIEGMKEHSRLHGRERVDVLDVGAMADAQTLQQAIQRRLAEARPGEIRGRVSARFGRQAVRDQGAQRRQV